MTARLAFALQERRPAPPAPARRWRRAGSWPQAPPEEKADQVVHHDWESSVWLALGVMPGATPVSRPGDFDESAASALSSTGPTHEGRPAGVRLHVGAGSEHAARSVAAAAFTVGTDIVLGGPAQHEPDPSPILRHELAHATQNAATPGPPRIQRQGLPEVGDRTEPVEVAAPPTLSDAGRQQLAAAEITLDPEDEATLSREFPDGFTLFNAPYFALDLWFGTERVESFRIDALRVDPLPPLLPTSEVWIPKIGKGRSILLSSTTGGRPSVLLDAGSGTSLSATGPRVQRLVASLGLITSGPASVPTAIRGSHADSDHYNAVRPLLSRPEFSRTTVEVAAEQLRGAGAGEWRTMSLTVQPTQRVIEIAVTSGAAPGAVIGPTGAQVHRQVTVLDGFTLVEFRSVEAHRDLADTSRSSFNRNRTSPVTIMIDHATAERRVFTSDAEGRQFSEIVDAVGEEAFRRLLGTGGRNLRSLEIPHHGGEQSGGPDIGGLLRMLRLSYEASGGQVALLAQTSTRFSAKPHSVFHFLDDAAVPSLRVTDDPSAAGSAEAIRLRGRATETVQLDVAGIRAVLTQAAAQETVLQGGHRRLAEVNELHGRLTALSQGLEAAGAYEEIRTSVRTMLTETEQARTETTRQVNAVWQAMETAARAAGGVRAGADMTGVRAAFSQLQTHLAGDNPVQRNKRNLEAHETAITSYSRLFTNITKMLEAYGQERVEELRLARAEHTRLVQAARGVLGNAEVDAHVRAAWSAARQSMIENRAEELAGQGGRLLAGRRLSVEFRTQLSLTLGRQLQLSQLAQQAMHGQLPSATGARFRSRAGNAALLLIEVARMGLELYTAVHESNLAMEAWESGLRATGTAEVAWYARRGVEPTLALLERSSWSGWNVVSTDMTQQAIRTAVTAATPPPGTPEFTMVVVTGIAPDALRRLVSTMSLGSTSTQGWLRENGSYPEGPLFREIGGEWGIRLWSVEDERMHYVRVDDIAPGLGAELSSLQAERTAAQAALLAGELAATAPEQVRTVRDTSWVGSATREVWAYGRSGRPQVVDFGDVAPRFILLEETEVAFGVRGRQGLVRAADSVTYQRLAETFWVRDTGRTQTSGTLLNAAVRVSEPNDRGLALVPIDDLVADASTRRAPAEAAARLAPAGPDTAAPGGR